MASKVINKVMGFLGMAEDRMKLKKWRMKMITWTLNH